MFSLKYLILVFLSVVVISEQARILAMFPAPSISHQVVFRPLTQELARRGHEVTVITPDPAFPKGQTPANLTEIDVHNVSYSAWQELYSVFKGKNDDTSEQLLVALRLFSQIFLKQMESEQVKNITQNENIQFDLLLLEACVRPALSISHIFKVPVILVSSLGPLVGNLETMGAPTHPMLYHGPERHKIYNLTLWEKVKELYDYYRFLKYFNNEIGNLDEEILQTLFGPDKPTFHELNNNVHMLFLNTNPIWEGNFPVPPGVIHMGGLHQKPEKELPEDLKKYLDSSEKGVVYVSFGTNVKPSLFPSDKIQILLKVFSELPYDILWKWDEDELPGKTSNIRIFKWLPQSDLLRHPKIKLFITQAGLQSIDEAINAGVPLVAIPMFADQWYNAEKCQHHKIGLQLMMPTLTDNKLRNAINTVIEDESYRHNIARLRTLINDQPMRPLDRAVWWTEYLLRNAGAKHLQSPAANISWSEYLELELVATVLLALSFVSLVIVCAMYYVVKFLSENSLRIKKMN